METDPTYAVSLPYRSPDPIDPALVARVAVEAEDAGFAGLWVSERTVGTVFCLDPVVALATAAALTSRLRLGVAVVVSPVHNPVRLAHQYSSLDFISGGRLTLGVGIGRDNHYEDFSVSKERRVTRFLEGLDATKQLWAHDDVTFDGEVVRFDHISINPKPVQQPHLPVWFGGTHPDALRRATRYADGWIGPGLQTNSAYAESVSELRGLLAETPDRATPFTVSKRVYVSVSTNSHQAGADMERWFTEVLGRPDMVHCGLSGPPEAIREELAGLRDAGADHLVLHPVAWSANTIETLTRVVA